MLTITTCKTYPSAPQNLIPVQTQLSNQGIPTQFLPWQETLRSQFILPLAAWDYANFYNEFTQWIKLHKSAFINPAELMLWNSHKGYLCDLQNWGINVIPILICSAKTSEILTALEQFRGDILQVPTMFSALKHNGKPLYEYARAGITVEREARPITIFELNFIEYQAPFLTLEVHCSKGTYIRTLVDDLGEVLGCGAHVTVLRRTAVADYPTEKMMTWDALQALAEQDDLVQLDQHLLPTDTAVSKLPALQLNAEQSKSIGFGQRVTFANEAKLHGQVRLFSDENIFLGVALVDDNNVIRPQRLITQSL